MELEQKVRYLIALGLSEKAARYYLRYETDTWAVVPSFRLLKPLSDDLEFYRGRYRELLVQWQGEGVLEKKDPEAAALLRAGATPEQVKEDLEGMQCMRFLARNMAWLLRCKEAGEKAGVPLPRQEQITFTNFIR